MVAKASLDDPEITAIGAVYAALKELPPDAQSRVLEFVRAKLGISSTSDAAHEAQSSSRTDWTRRPESGGAPERGEADVTDDAGGEFEGVSPVAKKWMARNGLQPNQLSIIFSIGGDEIDVIAKAVPSTTTKDKMHNVFYLRVLQRISRRVRLASATNKSRKPACTMMRSMLAISLNTSRVYRRRFRVIRAQGTPYPPRFGKRHRTRERNDEAAVWYLTPASGVSPAEAGSGIV
jgi:hypothetical protein